MKRGLGWYWFSSGKEALLDKEKCGKWMCYFTNLSFALLICQKALDQKVCYECKCSDLMSTQKEQGVICFYANGDDVDNHKRIIQFMLDNDLIEETNSGKLRNISFKFDHQTRAGEYGANYKGKIKLNQFLDLESGEWLDGDEHSATAKKPKKKTNYTRQLVDDYCVLDVETTGYTPRFNEIIEIALLRVRNNMIVDSYKQLIQPESIIPSGITDLTGITSDMVRGMPSIYEVKKEVLSFLGSDIIVGHNTHFDVGFLCAAFSIKLENPYVDTLQFAKKVFPKLRDHGLPFLSDYFGLSQANHRAMADCVATKELYDLIKQTMKEASLGIEDLWKTYKKSETSNERARKKYLGMEAKQRNGQIIKIIEYRNYSDIDIALDDGNVIYHTTVGKWFCKKSPQKEPAQRISSKEKKRLLEEKYNGENCSFGDDKRCDDSCKYYESCTRAKKE